MGLRESRSWVLAQGQGVLICEAWVCIKSTILVNVSHIVSYCVKKKHC